MPANINNFVNGNKTKIIAPAGYGKTHFISDCIQYAYEHNLGKQLILTHTHAGIASIKEKLSENNIPVSAYRVETICGYAQKYVFSFIDHSTIPEQDSNDFYTFIIKQATMLFEKKSIQSIIKATYKGIFIDEYQDCTVNQHAMLMKLKNIVSLHILGDPMQGIFSFDNTPLIDFDADLNDFDNSAGELDIPWRWQLEDNNIDLGNDLKSIRQELLRNNTIAIDSYNNIIIETITGTIYDDPNYKSKLYATLNDGNVLLIAHGQINQRKSLRRSLGSRYRIQLLEAIDDKSFYSIAKDLDVLLTSGVQFSKFITIAKKLFASTDIDFWFNNNGLKRKSDPIYKQISESILPFVTHLVNSSACYDDLYQLFYKLKNTFHLNCWRADLLRSIIVALKNASSNNIEVKKAMDEHKNHIRVVGRKVYGKCIGTTLLTKGLEFDNVVILDAQNFTDKKNFYVAITRACKKLTIFTTNTTLTFRF